MHWANSCPARLLPKQPDVPIIPSRQSDPKPNQSNWRHCDQIHTNPIVSARPHQFQSNVIQHDPNQTNAIQSNKAWPNPEPTRCKCTYRNPLQSSPTKSNANQHNPPQFPLAQPPPPSLTNKLNLKQADLTEPDPMQSNPNQSYNINIPISWPAESNAMQSNQIQMHAILLN